MKACEKCINTQPKVKEAWFTKASLMARTGSDPEEVLEVL